MVLPILKKTIPNLKVYIVGGSASNKIRKRIAKEKFIFLTGFVKNLNKYLRAANTYVYPSKIGSGMKTRTLEALGSGCKVVSTSQGVIGLKTNKNFCQVSDDNYKFAEMIYNSIKLDFSMKDRISVSKQVEKEYSWDKTSLKILSLYKKIK